MFNKVYNYWIWENWAQSICFAAQKRSCLHGGVYGVAIKHTSPCSKVDGELGISLQLRNPKEIGSAFLPHTISPQWMKSSTNILHCLCPRQMDPDSVGQLEFQVENINRNQHINWNVKSLRTSNLPVSSFRALARLEAYMLYKALFLHAHRVNYHW